MSAFDKIREHMQVIDAEGTPIGTVDHIDGDRLKLTRSDSGPASTPGKHHFVPRGLVADVEGDFVRLSARIDALEALFETAEGEGG